MGVAGPMVGVVLPSHRRLDQLPVILRTYLAQGVDELVLVLDGPHPGWREALSDLVHEPRLTVIELDPNRGLALARREGLERATKDVVLIADDDVVPCEGLVEAHRAFHAEHERAALLGYMPVDVPARRGRDQAPTFVYARDYLDQVAAWRLGDSSTLLRSFWGGNASIRRGLYLEAERFRPSVALPYNEDLDLGLRLLAVGATAGFRADAVARHLHRRGLDAFLRECEVRGEAVAMLTRRWATLPEAALQLVAPPVGRPRLVRCLQRRVGAASEPGTVERLAVAGYRAAGVLRAWTIQDGLARFLRRGLAIRGYRMATEAPSASVSEAPPESANATRMEP